MNSEGQFWKDPPGYFEQLVYPAYADAHRAMFTVRIFLFTTTNLDLRAHASHRTLMWRMGHRCSQASSSLNLCK